MVTPFTPRVIRAVSRDGQTVWLTIEDRWSRKIEEAEILDDEAHADIRLLEAEMQADAVRDVRLVELSEAIAA